MHCSHKMMFYFSYLLGYIIIKFYPGFNVQFFAKRCTSNTKNAAGLCSTWGTSYDAVIYVASVNCLRPPKPKNIKLLFTASHHLFSTLFLFPYICILLLSLSKTSNLIRFKSMQRYTWMPSDDLNFDLNKLLYFHWLSRRPTIDHLAKTQTGENGN